MGAIQNTANAALGAVAAATVAGEKAKEIKAEEQLEKEALIEQTPALKEEIEKNKAEEEQAQKNLEQAQTGRNELGQFKNKEQVNKDILMAQLALNTVQGKQEARKMQLDRMEKRLKTLGGGSK